MRESRRRFGRARAKLACWAAHNKLTSRARFPSIHWASLVESTSPPPPTKLQVFRHLPLASAAAHCPLGPARPPDRSPSFSIQRAISPLPLPLPLPLRALSRWSRDKWRPAPSSPAGQIITLKTFPPTPTPRREEFSIGRKGRPAPNGSSGSLPCQFKLA